MIVSQSSTSSVYATSATQRTSIVLAYDTSSTQSIQQTDKLAQMEEKYKDIFTPMPSKYSEDIENLRNSIVREEYPNFLTLNEYLNKYGVSYQPNMTEEEKQAAKITAVENHNKYVRSLGGEASYQDSLQYMTQVYQNHPVNFWDRQDMKVSNSKELATFYNAAVYESLESGKSVEEASTIAFHAINSYMDTSQYYDNTLGKVADKYAGADAKWSKPEINYSLTIDLREFGFNMDVNTTQFYQNEKDMQAFAQKKLDYYNFIINNQDIVNQKFNNLNSSYIRNTNSYDDVVKPVIDYYQPQAEIAVNVFSKYKIFDSVDIKV